jgi:hypothetical protein
LQVCLRSFILAGVALACAPLYGQQNPADNTAPGAQQTPDKRIKPQDPNEKDPRDTRNRPLTPAEEFDQQLKQFDPLAAPDAPKPGGDQRVNPNPNVPDAQPPARTDAPPPGSIAATNQLNAPAKGPKIVEDEATNAAQEYTGPAVLSRSYTINRPMIAQDLKWKETIGLGTSFSFGATSAVPGVTTPVASGNILSATANASISGRRQFRHDQLGLALNWQYQRSYPSSLNYSGPNTSLAFDYTHIVSRRINLTFSQNASMLSQNYTLQNPTVDPNLSIASINIASSPSIQIFDTSTKQFASQVDLTWQKTTRLSFDLGVSYFAIVRDPRLIGNDGEQARGDVNYRLSQKTTVGISYSHSHYKYQHGEGTTDSNTIGLIYSYAFSRSLQLRTRVGATRTETIGFTTIPLSPLLAALLGRPTVVIDAYRQVTTSDLSGQLVKDFRGGQTASLAYSRGVSPGNGVFQTSQQQTFSASGSMKVFRKYPLSLSVTRSSLSSLAQSLGNYTSDSIQVSTSRSIFGHFAWNVGVGYRRFLIAGTPGSPGQYIVNTSVSWSPSNGKLWPF